MNWEFDLLYQLQELRQPIIDRILTFISTLGNGGVIWILAALVLLAIKRYRKIGWQVALSMLLTVIIGNLILKNLVARDRPCWIDPDVALLVRNPWDYSFPSGHAMNGFAASVAMLINDKRLGIPAVLFAAVIAFSRLYLFVHFPTDVLAGILLGTVDAVIVCLLYRRYEKVVTYH